MSNPILYYDELEDIYSQYDDAQLIYLIGFPALGKSTSLRNLPPENTYIFNVEGKHLPMPLAAGLKKDTKGDGSEGNIQRVNDYTKISKALRELKKREEIKFVIIDDGTYLMTAEFMSKINVKGYDKFNQMAGNMWDLLHKLKDRLRPDQKAIFIGHMETDPEEGTKMNMKTTGKLTREKLDTEGLTSTILVPAVDRERNEDKSSYFFYTQSDGVVPARSLMGMYPYKVKNDLLPLLNRMDEYFKGVSLENSKINLEPDEVGKAKTAVIR